MTATLRIDDLAAFHGDRTLFSGLDLTVTEGDVIGLVGANGAGKSTLLTLLAGVGTADWEGEDPHQPARRHRRLSRARKPERLAGESVLAFVGRRTGVTAAEQAMNEAAEALGGEDGEDRYTPALERWLALGGGRSSGADRESAGRPGAWMSTAML